MKTFRVTAPDGTTHEVEANTQQEAIFKVRKTYQPAAAPAATPAATPNVTPMSPMATLNTVSDSQPDAASDVVHSGIGGALQGLGDLARPFHTAATMIPGVGPAIGNLSKMVGSFYDPQDKLGTMSRYEPKTAVGKFAKRGAALASTTAPVSTALRAGGAAASVGRDTLAGFTGGLLGQGVEEAGGGPIAQTVAEMAGAPINWALRGGASAAATHVPGVAAAGRGAKKVLEHVPVVRAARMMNPQVQRLEARENFRKFVKGGKTPHRVDETDLSVRNIDRSPDVYGVSATTPVATGSARQLGLMEAMKSDRSLAEHVVSLTNHEELLNTAYVRALQSRGIDVSRYSTEKVLEDISRKMGPINKKNLLEYARKHPEKLKLSPELDTLATQLDAGLVNGVPPSLANRLSKNQKVFDEHFGAWGENLINKQLLGRDAKPLEAAEALLEVAHPLGKRSESRIAALREAVSKDMWMKVREWSQALEQTGDPAVADVAYKFQNMMTQRGMTEAMLKIFEPEQAMMLAAMTDHMVHKAIKVMPEKVPLPPSALQIAARLVGAMAGSKAAAAAPGSAGAGHSLQWAQIVSGRVKQVADAFMGNNFYDEYVKIMRDKDYAKTVLTMTEKEIKALNFKMRGKPLPGVSPAPFVAPTFDEASP